MRLKSLALALSIGAVALAVPAETWKNAPIVDAQCVDKVKADPDKHTAKCALACEDGGYGILAADGTFLKFDAAGNARALSAIQASKKTDHLRATVEGKLSGAEIQVTSLKLD